MTTMAGKIVKDIVIDKVGFSLGAKCGTSAFFFVLGALE